MLRSNPFCCRLGRRLFHAMGPLSRSSSSSSLPSYYAVRVGRKPGIYSTWEECKQMIDKYPGAKYKKFKEQSEAQSFAFPAISTSTTSGSSVPEKGNSRYKPYALARGDTKSTSGRSTHKKKADKRVYLPAGETPEEIVVYTDGASSKNGQKGAKAGVGVYFGKLDPRNIAEPLKGERQTNQRAELTAILRAMEKQQEHESASNTSELKSIRIMTDSMYSIKCLTEWFVSWEKNQWKRKTGQPVENVDLVQGCLALIRQRQGKVNFTYVPGHSGIEGNERADELAVFGSTMS